jgi:hypothetical protein
MSDAIAAIVVVFAFFALFAWFMVLPTVGLLRVLGAI